SRLGPGKPGHATCVFPRSLLTGAAIAVSTAAGAVDACFAPIEGVETAAGVTLALGIGASLGVSARAADAGSGLGPSLPRASSSCSEVGVHRQWNSPPAPPLIPAVRMRSKGAHARRIAAT